MFYLNLKKYLSKTSVLFFVIFLSFFVFRFTQIDRPYHQDEYKWPQYSQPEVYPPGSVPHPPLTEYFFKITNILFGENYYRMTPFILSFLSLILLCIFVQRRFDTKTALISGALFSLSFYAVLGSLTVDTDGAILPFFLMLSLNFYDLSINNLSLKNIYIPLLFIALFLGLMVKLSFILVIGALIIDFLILHKDKITKKYILYGIFTALSFVFIVIISLLISKYLFNGFSLEKGIKYWSTFLVGLNNRNFFQTAIQFIKAIFYLSPLLIFSSLASLYYRNQKLNIFYIFSVLGLIFYLVLFDFSIGALDRYLVFLVIPLCILSGYAIKNIFEIKDVVNKKIIGLSGVLIFIIYILQFINQYVPPLHPKTEWIGRIFSFKWNFLYPFFGGSGPLGFYISFSFIALSFITTAIFFVLFVFKKQRQFFIPILLLGIVYNFNFIEEFNLGKINGYSPALVREAVSFIKSHKNIEKVLVYNDNGGYNIRQTGKYQRRFYADPKFSNQERVDYLNNNKIYYYVLDIPKIQKGSIYEKFLGSCKEEFSNRDGYINSIIYNCKDAKDVSL